MAEIKSTFDLIMEKTRGMTMTEDEREEARRKELSGKVRGLLQKYLDGRMDRKALGEELAGLPAEDRKTLKGILVRECADRINPEGDNRRLVAAFWAAGIDPEPFEALLGDFRRELDLERRVRERAMRAVLAKRGISGEAVIPNVEADPEWSHYRRAQAEALRERLDGLAEAVPG